MKLFIKAIALLVFAAILTLPAYADSADYSKMVDDYQSGRYEDVFRYGFSDEADWSYEGTEKYACLAAAQLYDVDELIDFIIDNLEFEDAKEIAVRDDFYFNAFMSGGVWRNDDNNFKLVVQPDGEKSWRYPTVMETGGWFSWTTYIEDGTEYACSPSFPAPYENIRVSVIGNDSVIIHNFVTGNDYYFHREPQ